MGRGYWELGSTHNRTILSSPLRDGLEGKKKQPVLTFRGPCSAGREVMKHLLCASLDACHLTYIVSHIVLTPTEEEAAMASVNSLRVNVTRPLRSSLSAGIPTWGRRGALPIAGHCLPVGKVSNA